ncbi:MFS transporter [Pseudomonas putida]|uniref:MFS transporter n=1 Tax=Pseudomonas TaxID=286 RepID=UPI001198C8C3|nr:MULTISPECIES: MFS transporter [Pseudomonas]EKT4559789.1 MFS transporter [Pseudomonas putida]MCE0777634.1 MFS transporter [Pseudomonas sp. NMI542_15]MDP9540036.1 MFS transporter [Pseudomonas putida]QDY38890.1 MFS transporter [Pseudomonas putida]
MNMSGRNTLAIMLAASFASTIGGLPFNTLPILLGSMVDSLGFTVEQIGLLGSVCFAGYLLGTLLAVVLIDRMNWRWLTLGCAFGAAAAYGMSSWLPPAVQSWLWAVIGFFAALMTCLGMRIMGEMANKERALGMRLGIELGVVAAVLFALPSLVIAYFHYTGAALMLAAIILLLSLSALALPRRQEFIHEAQQGQADSLLARFRFPPAAYAALAFFFLFGAGQIGLWAFLERLGHGLALQPAELGIVFAVLKLLGGAAALALAVVGDRLGVRVPHLIVLAVLGTGLLLLGNAEGFLMYAAGAWIWEVGFTWGCVYQTAAIARLDRSGRSIMLIPGAFALSSMAGPALAGQLVSEGFGVLLWLAAGCALIPVLAFTWLLAPRLQNVGTGCAVGVQA